MTGPALARSRGGRRYVWPPNTDKPELVVPSVTTILNHLAKPALVKAAAKEVANFAVDQLLAWEKLPSPAALALLKGTPDRVWDVKKQLGSDVHKAVEQALDGWDIVDTDKVIDIDNIDLLPWVGAAITFMQDQVSKLLFTEITVFNRTYKYAGTCDAIVTLNDGRTAIVDWKSGSIWPEASLQLSAYANAEFIGHDDGTPEDLPEFDLGIVVHLPGDGTYKAYEVELSPVLWKTFIACRTIQRFKDDFEDDVFGKTTKGSARKADAATA